MQRKPTRALLAAVVLSLAAAGCASSAKTSGDTSSPGSSASDVGVTPTTIKVGYISSQTGIASSTSAGAVEGAIARFDLQNAEGGVHGRKIELVPEDDQSSPTQFLTGAQDLVQNKKVFAVLPISSFTFAGASYLNKQGIPVVGSAFDGPEWGEQPYRNMFSFLPPYSTTYAGKNYDYSTYGKFLRDIGVTKLAGVAYGVSPSSQEAVHAIFASAVSRGVASCYSDYSVPFGAVDFTATALAIKNAGCDGTVAALVDSSNNALAQAEENAGSSSRHWFEQGYDQQTLDSPTARRIDQGAYVSTSVIFSPSIPAVTTMLGALQKYGHFRAGTIPNFGTWTSYAAADLFIRGLEAAGRNPTRPSYIANLRQVTGYSAGGLLPFGISFTGFGTPAMFPPTTCSYFVQLKDGKWVPFRGNGEVCGTRISFSY
jgi:branched-chain amino acid transport system substrate-binding protein